MCVNVCVCVVGCVCVRACTWLRVRQQCLRVATQHAGARKEQCCVCVYMFACARKVIVQTPDLGIHFVRCCVCACVLRRPVSVCHCVYMLMPRHCLCRSAKHALCVCVREGGGEGGGSRIGWRHLRIGCESAKENNSLRSVQKDAAARMIPTVIKSTLEPRSFNYSICPLCT